MRQIKLTLSWLLRFRSMHRLSFSGLLMLVAISPTAGAQPLPVAARNADDLRGLISTGRVYSLAIVTGRKTPALAGRTFDLEVFAATGDQPSIGKNRLSGHDDRVILSNGIGTQIDGLAHVGIDGVHFGGVKAADIFDADGVKRYGTDTIGAIVQRGLLLDIAAVHGVAVLPDSYAISAQDLRAALKRQEQQIMKDDVLLIHTGWLTEAGDNSERFLATAPGISVGAAEFLADQGVTAVGADTWAVEVVPAEQPEEMFPAHQVLLARHGVFLLENIQTAHLVQDQVDEFLFVLGVPRLEGSVQAVINPVAID